MQSARDGPNGFGGSFNLGGKTICTLFYQPRGPRERSRYEKRRSHNTQPNARHYQTGARNCHLLSVSIFLVSSSPPLDQTDDAPVLPPSAQLRRLDRTRVVTHCRKLSV